MIYEAGPIPRGRRLTQYQTNSRRTGVDNSMHALGATIETLRGATAHRGLLTVAVESSNDRVSDLLNQ